MVINRCFSPVAGIQWVETSIHSNHDKQSRPVSVPLPGFSGLRPFSKQAALKEPSFSPVAGIQWVETSTIDISVFDF